MAMLPPFRSEQSVRGFSLIELMTVLAVMAVAMALVVPRLFDLRSDAENGELKRLAGALLLASERAEESGYPIRWRAHADSYRFEQLNDAGEWQLLKHTSFQEHHFEQVTIRSVEIDAMLMTLLPSGVEEAEDSFGIVLFLPDRSVTPATIHFAAIGDSRAPQIRVAPGPGGIAVEG